MQHTRKLNSLAGLSYFLNELLENIRLVEDFQTLKKSNTQKKILCRIHLSYFGKADSPLELKHVLNDIFQVLSLAVNSRITRLWFCLGSHIDKISPGDGCTRCVDAFMKEFRLKREKSG